MRFSTRVDWWIGLLMFWAGAMPPAVTAFGLLGHRIEVVILGLIATGVMAAVLLGTAIPVRYELHDRELVIRSGLLRFRIAYSGIKSVRPSRSFLKAPAWSLDRLALEYSGSFLGNPVLISPKEKEEFLAELSRREPALARVPGENVLVRKEPPADGR